MLLTFAREMFGADTKIRLRPSYFPFTEPSAEMDISCNICGGEGCGFCKHTGWVEILGCGMVDLMTLRLVALIQAYIRAMPSVWVLNVLLPQVSC